MFNVCTCCCVVMGGDGGSIPRRVELVRSKQKKENVGKVAVDAAKWKHCALSQQPLRQPIVACQLGRSVQPP